MCFLSVLWVVASVNLEGRSKNEKGYAFSLIIETTDGYDTIGRYGAFYHQMNTVASHFTNCWKKSFVFSGRSSRAEYWSFTLINALVIVLLASVASVINEKLVVVGILYAGSSLFPYLSAVVRRVRDTGMSFWLLLLGIIPYIGQFFILGLLLMPSKNKH